jgi:carbon-monoxide dehydrogenase medium subunit
VDLPVDRVLRPASPEEALAMLAQTPGAVPIAGGTDLVVQLRDGRCRARSLVDLSGLELSWIREPDGTLEIGAGTAMDVIADSEAVRRCAPALAAAAGQVGAWPIQCRATIGGNLANASPAADTVPPLLVAGAGLELVSLSGARTVPVADFFSGPGRTVRRPDELIRSIRVPVLGDRGFERFAKVGPRREQIIAVVSVAIRAEVTADRRLTAVRVAVGSSAPTPVRACAAEASLEGRMPTEEVRREALTALQKDIAPIDDVRAPAGYRRLAAAAVLDRWLAEIAHG